MSPDEPTRRERDDARDADEIEIVEVVGLEPDDAAEDGTEVATDPERRGGEPDEIELVFDEGSGEDPGASIAEPAESGDGAVDREQFLRLHADFENFRKRSHREMEETVQRANAELVTRLLPILDNLERALAAPGPNGDDPFREGVAMIHRQIVEELRKEGLEAVEAVGQAFDPAVHEAVSTDSSGRYPPNIVVEEMQRGYRFRNRLLRPALVTVSVDHDDDATDEIGASES